MKTLKELYSTTQDDDVEEKMTPYERTMQLRR